MPKLRIGDIPAVRIKDARQVRDAINDVLCGYGRASVSLIGGTFGVVVQWPREDDHLPSVPEVFRGVPLKVTQKGEYDGTGTSEYSNCWGRMLASDCTGA